jgi:excisionase family DNA binding protein
MLTVADVARRWNVSRSWVWRRVRAGELPYYRPSPRAIRFDGFEIEQWFAEYHHTPAKRRSTRRKARTNDACDTEYGPMMEKTQTGISRTYVVARQPMKMGDHLRQVGELVPEAADWPIQAQDAWLRQGWLEEVPLVSDADRRAVAQQWEREEAVRAEAAAKRKEAEAQAPPAPPPVPEGAVKLACANCRTPRLVAVLGLRTAADYRTVQARARSR